MKQSVKASWIESVLNIAIGMGVAFVSQLLVFGAMGIQVAISQNIIITLIFTFISLCRSFLVRRWFEYLRVSGILP